MDETLQELGEHVARALGEAVSGLSVRGGELTLFVPADRIVKVLNFLKSDTNCQFKQLMDICGVDYPERPERFTIVYHLLSMRRNLRVRVKLETGEETPVPSVTGVFATAGWFEREVWDMYGVMFADHPDLRRILTDYGFEGHPLRKDFPLTGYVELRYSEEHKRVIYEPVKLAQEYRDFDFMSPWEGAKYILADDDAAQDETSGDA